MSNLWANAPNWAIWAAQDEDGQWYWYKDKPVWDSALNTWLTPLRTLHMAALQENPVSVETSKHSLILRPEVLKRLVQKNLC